LGIFFIEYLTWLSIITLGLGENSWMSIAPPTTKALIWAQGEKSEKISLVGAHCPTSCRGLRTATDKERFG
jgi:hypothetical protein